MASQFFVAAVSLLATAATVDAADVRKPWDPKLFSGAFMFKDAAEFRRYLAGADVVAVGTLTALDDSRGKVTLEKTFRGKADAVVEFKPSGGLIAASKGQRVIVLLKRKGKRSTLHSFCAASGLFKHSKRLESVIRELVPKK